MIPLATHCGPIAGGFGCDMGDLPATPAALAWGLVALAVVVLLYGVYMLSTGLPPVRFGRLKEISTARAGRLLGLALVLDSLVFVLLAQVINLLSQHIEPARWSALVFSVPLLLVVGLQWLAFRSDRRPTLAP